MLGELYLEVTSKWIDDKLSKVQLPKTSYNIDREGGIGDYSNKKFEGEDHIIIQSKNSKKPYSMEIKSARFPKDKDESKPPTNDLINMSLKIQPINSKFKPTKLHHDIHYAAMKFSPNTGWVLFIHAVENPSNYEWEEFRISDRKNAIKFVKELKDVIGGDGEIPRPTELEIGVEGNRYEVFNPKK